MNQSPECPVWTLPTGSLLHIGGMPYLTTSPTVIEGFGDPVERLKPVPLTGMEHSITCDMNNTPLKNYGFEYEFQGRQFMFDVVARSADEATAKAAAMRNATMTGEMKAVDDAPGGPESLDFARLGARVKALEDRNTLADKANFEANAVFISMYKAQIMSPQTPHEPRANPPCQ